MSSSFNPKKYFKKIYSHEILTEFYRRHNIVAIFEITESTSRKNTLSIFNDFYNNLEIETRLDIEEELMLIDSVSTKNSPYLLSLLLKENNITEITQIECDSDYDKVLYHYLFNREIFDLLVFFHNFYTSHNYMLYEAKEVDLIKADLSMTELNKEFTCIANKENNVTSCDLNHKILNDILYIDFSFLGKPILQNKKDTDTKEIKKIRKNEEVKIAYLPKNKEVLISYTGSKNEKLIFLDTFLRVVCDCGYDEKIESFNLDYFSNNDFDFTKTNKNVPLLTWKVKGVTVSFGNKEKQRKKMKLSIPNSYQEYGLSPLLSTLEEIGLLNQFKQYKIENITLSFSFSDINKGDKSVLTPCSISRNKSSLCSLFSYDRYARTLLKQSNIEEGFIKLEKKEKIDVIKKWEI